MNLKPRLTGKPVPSTPDIFMFCASARSSWASTATSSLKNSRGLGLEAVCISFRCIFIILNYQRQYGYRQSDFANAEDAYERCISLPIFPGMTAAEVERVIAGVLHIVQQNRHPMTVVA